MKSNPVADEKQFVNLLISWISRQTGTPTRNGVEETAQKLADIYEFKTNLEPVITEALTAVDTQMGAGISLVDVETPHDDKWVSKREDIHSIYSNAYEDYLKGEGWAPPVIQSLSDVSARILGHLQDPNNEGDWDRRGLVIGHVQSGKTANYMGVIAKAADAGYKFIIIIAGIHNNLRKQTQERVDEGFVGRSSEPGNHTNVGVGANKDYPHPATLTNIHQDFNKNTAAQSGWQINDFTKPIILVIKKNVRTLDSLYNWLRDMNAQGHGRISDVPMLMIDDEADHASINTNREDIDPTRTNAMIRKILRLFAKSCYVGYTATPFANIFINPESYGDEEVHKELFPRDFIYCLDPPSTYFGPERVFVDEDDGADAILEPITDCENYLPQAHKNYYEIPDLPPSLYRAIDQFIVARAIRNLRGHVNKHCSMMINVSRFVVVQQSVRNLISVYLKKMREAVKANYKMPDAVADHNEYMRALKERFSGDYKSCSADWRDVKKELFAIFDHLHIYTINSRSDEVLNYKKYEQEGYGLTAIAIGGLSLSRGLTIEGLCVSYMYRNTRMYDTLMQMGRWFGFRPGYEDLCKVHLSDDSINWYAHIADASKELRQQIRRMRQANLGPIQFGLYVKAHPDSLLITARNKMRSGESVKLKLNLSAKLIESHTLPLRGDINQRNEKLIARYWQAGFGRPEIEPVDTGKGWIVKDVPTEVIEEFLFEFETDPSFTDRKNHANQYLQALSDRYPRSDVLLISLQNNDEDSRQYRLGVQERGSARNKGDVWRMSKDRVASRGDEKLGLSPQQVKEAEALSRTDEPPPKAPSDIHFRIVRNKPLLMLHVINPSPKEQQRIRIPAFGISFPEDNYETEIEVVANAVWIEQMYDTSTDSPDQEDDYDE